MDHSEQQQTHRETEEEIDLYELFFLFRQKIKGIAISRILGGLVVGLFTFFFIAPKYQATSKLYIVSASNDSVVNLTDLQIGASLTADYEQLILSRPVLESVIQSLGLDITTKELKESLEISNPANTRILDITATSTDPALAKDIANEVARLAVEWLPEVMESNTPNIAEDAIQPTQKSSPSYSTNMVMGALLAALGYMAVVFIQFISNDTIRTEEELEHYFGILPLAAIPEDDACNDELDSWTSNTRGGAREQKRGGRGA